jgi:hypothetical protein
MSGVPRLAGGAHPKMAATAPDDGRIVDGMKVAART